MSHYPMRDPDEQRARTNLFRAGSVAMWVWIALGLLLILTPVICCGFCGLGGIIGGVATDPSPSP